MKRYALTDKIGQLLGFYSDDVNTIPAGAFEISEAIWLDWQAKAGTHLWDTKKKTLIEKPIAPPTIDDLISYTADKRWRVETGGLTLNGVPVGTDDRSKIMIMGARMKAEANPDYVERWKAGDGLHVDLTAPQLIAISNAVLDFVSACFATEGAVVDDIKAGKIRSLAEIDAYAWPGGAS